eukprot:gene13184-14532_t
MASEQNLIDYLKRARSFAKGSVTRKANKLTELIETEGNPTLVRVISKELRHSFKEFQTAHEAYDSKLEAQDEKEESARYHNAVLELVSNLETQTDKWLEPSIDVRPEDSISNISVSTRSSKPRSDRSSASEKARATAKKAALEAKAESLKRLHELQIQELKVQQQRVELELHSDIAAAEAERNVYEQAECSSSIAPRSPVINHPQPIYPVLTQHDSKPPQQVYQTPIVQDQTQHQNNALQQLTLQQQQGVMALTLPQPTMQVFSGDPIDYSDFVRSFEHIIEEKTPSPSTRLYYLVQYTTGAAQDLMKSCLSMRESEGYTTARRLLKERFGQNYRIATAHVQRVIEGKPIKAEDGNALQQFSIELTSCSNTLKEIGYSNRLDNPDNLKKVIDRLPYGLKLQWRDVVDRIMERENREITVHDITEFVSTKARAATHPIFGKIVNENKFKPVVNQQRRQTSARATGFSTQTESQHSNASNKTPKCPLCSNAHWLARCDRFRKQSLEDRQKLIKEKKLCLNCLSDGHFVRSCSKESFCKVNGCVGKHSTFLHPKSNQNVHGGSNEQSTSNQSTPTINPNSTPASSGYVEVSEGTSFSTSATTTALAIVPVLVKARESTKLLETYAFLDSGSNTSFCTESLLQNLEVEGKRTKLSLTTMQGENNAIECSLVSLQVSDMNRNKFIDLPMVFSRPNLPISTDAISKQEDVNRWPYLQGIKIPEINAEIGLLIGSDVPQALQPIEVRQSRNGGPFATKTTLGWVLNGPVGRKEPKIHTSSFVQTKPTLDEQFLEFCEMEFNDSKYPSEAAMSQNDRQAQQIMENTVKLVEGHYEMALPWKQYPPHLPNNKSLAEHRLSLLRKRLKKDPIVHEKYEEFVGKMLRKDYARRVPDNASTSPQRVIESIPESERSENVKDLSFDQLPVERALGVQWRSADSWPQQPIDLNLNSEDPEIKKSSTVCISKISESDLFTDIINRFSSLNRLKRVVAWILRYISKLKNRIKNGHDERPCVKQSEVTPLSLSEINNAEIVIIKHVQRKCFKEELDCLETRELQSNNTRNILKKTSNIYKLDPFLSEGLIRVGGRLRQAPIIGDAQCPIILPKKHHLIDLVIQHYH